MRNFLSALLFFCALAFVIPTWASKLSLELKIAEAEAKDTAWDQRKELLALLQSISSDELVDDYLPEGDKGKKIDPKHLKDQAQGTAPKAKASATHAKSHDQYDIDQIAAIAQEVITSPHASVAIVKEVSTDVPEELRLVTCQEGGNYQIAMTQLREVDVVPKKIVTSKICQGHEESQTYASQKKAGQALKTMDIKLSQDPTISTKSVTRNKKKLKAKYVHQDDAATCNKYITQERVISKGSQTDRWIADDAAAFSQVPSNPQCRLLYTKIIEGPATRVIKGQPVSLDAWKRQLFFSCEGGINSKCQALRDQGGVLLSKKCVKETSFGQCDLWEKTFDLGKRAAAQDTEIEFQDDGIYGLSQIKSPEQEKNTELGQAATILSSFADLEHELEETNQPVSSSKARVFKGKEMRCSRSFLNNVLYDCCQKLSGLAVKSKLAVCSEDEKCLSQHRSDGKCHFIGTKSAKLGTETEQVYCCFPTKLSRVIHEQGRKQLGIGWGSADKPKCRGFRLAELQRIDFSKLDLSEAVEDLAIDREEMQSKLKRSAENLELQNTHAANKQIESLHQSSAKNLSRGKDE